MPNGHEYDGDEEPVEVGDLLTTAGVFLDLNLFVEWSPELTPVLHYYLLLYTKPNARFTIIVDLYAAQSYASQASAYTILIEL